MNTQNNAPAAPAAGKSILPEKPAVSGEQKQEQTAPENQPTPAVKP
jgi:hypothetical protein